MTNTDWIKAIVGTTAGIGVYGITSAIIKTLVVPSGTIGALFIFAGRVTLAFMASDAAANYIEQKIDNFADAKNRGQELANQ